MIVKKTYDVPAVCHKEILRYAGCRQADSAVESLLAQCLQEAEKALTYQACYRELPVKIQGKICDFTDFCVESEALARNLQDCHKGIVFAATVGVGLDRLIEKYSRLAPSKALMLQAIGAERIEALCDAVCADLAERYGMGLKPRFSPGYGDLPLETQRKVFEILDCQRQIGLTLNRSLSMSPTKSVTAFVGLKGS